MQMKVLLYLNDKEGLLTLKELLFQADIRLIVLPNDNKNEEIIEISKKNNIDVVFRDKNESVLLDAYHECTIISSAFPFKIYLDEVQSVIRAVNFHAAILPKYRGRHGNIWAMINDEEYLGVTIHEIDDSFDNGKIIDIEKFKVFDSMSLLDIQQSLFRALKKLLNNFVIDVGRNYYNGKLSKSIYWRSRTLSDSRVNWFLNHRQVFLFVRALSRMPIYAYSNYGRNKFNFDKIEISYIEFNKLPGTVCYSDADIYICTGDNKSIKVLKYRHDFQILTEGMVLH